MTLTLTPRLLRSPMWIRVPGGRPTLCDRFLTIRVILLSPLNSIAPPRSFLPVAVVQVVGQDGAAVLVVVAVGAEVLPVAPVGRIVVVVAVPVVDGEELEVVLIELPAALGADPAMELERALPVVFVARLLRLHPAHQLVQLLLAFDRHRSRSQ